MPSPAFKLFLCLLPVALATALSHAQVPATLPLPEWDQLSEEQREQLTAPTRDRWNNANAEQRLRMLNRAAHWQQMDSNQRARISGTIGRWQNLPPGQHHELRAVFHHLRPLQPSGREAFLEQWKAMSAEQRSQWANEHPAPARRRSGHHRNAPPDPDAKD